MRIMTTKFLISPKFRPLNFAVFLYIQPVYAELMNYSWIAYSGPWVWKSAVLFSTWCVTGWQRLTRQQTRASCIQLYLHVRYIHTPCALPVLYHVVLSLSLSFSLSLSLSLSPSLSLSLSLRKFSVVDNMGFLNLYELVCGLVARHLLEGGD